MLLTDVHMLCSSSSSSSSSLSELIITRERCYIPVHEIASSSPDSDLCNILPAAHG